MPPVVARGRLAWASPHGAVARRALAGAALVALGAAAGFLAAEHSTAPSGLAADAAGANPLEAIARAHRGRVLWKWPQYFAPYHRELSALRHARRTTGGAVLIEIGVNTGGAIDLWREYFGGALAYHGVDLNPKTAVHRDEANGVHVHVGAQDDGAFLREVVAAAGGRVDVVVDDGSHLGKLSVASFAHLWEALADDGGIYIIEDIHTSQAEEVLSLAARAAAAANALDTHFLEKREPPDDECALVVRGAARDSDAGESGSGGELRLGGFCRQAYRVSIYHGMVVFEKRAFSIQEAKMYGDIDAFEDHPSDYFMTSWWKELNTNLNP